MREKTKTPNAGRGTPSIEFRSFSDWDFGCWALGIERLPLRQVS